MLSGSILKATIALLLIGNLGFAGYNVTHLMDRSDFQSHRDDAINQVVQIKKDYYRYQNDIRKISTEKIISVDTPNGYFAERARLAGFDPLRDMLIPKKSTPSPLGGNFQQEVWKISFAKKQTHDLQKVARFCELIEAGSPQFQIKNVNLGKRSEIWGKNEWTPQEIQVRRISRKTKKSSGRR